MDRLYRTLAQFGKLNFRTRQDDDWIDRMNYVYTSIILVISSIIVSTKQYVGEPIICWTPAQFTSSHQVPFVLLLQAIFFYVPCLVWRTMNSQSGINVKTIVRLACDVHNLNPETRSKTIKYLARHIQLCIENQREYRSGWSVRLRQFVARNFCIICGKRYGNYLIILYMISKLLYIFNVVGEILFLEKFLGHNYTLYGLQVLIDLQQGREWTVSGRFPRVTMCDFQVRKMANIHRYTVQCVLPINMFNEKLLIFLWWWFMLVAALTMVSFFTWMFSMLFKTSRARFVRKYLKILNKISKRDYVLVDRFTHLYLRHDGVFVLRLIGKNAGELVVSEILESMWTNFCSKAGQELIIKQSIPTTTTSQSLRSRVKHGNGVLTGPNAGLTKNEYSMSSALDSKAAAEMISV